MSDLRLGILLWSQGSDWAGFLNAARRVDGLGYEHLWTWDHLYAIFGDPYQPIFEGYTALAALAAVIEGTRMGLLVGANTFRNPGLVAKMIATIDHISGGRAIAGLGGAWFELEHTAHGVDFGTGFGQRLDWLDESVGAIRTLLDGGEVTYQSPKYRFERLRQAPSPVQAHVPIMIGGSGEKKTLRTVAKYADMWNAIGPAETLRRKEEVLRAHCSDVGRQQAEIERTVGCKITIRDTEEEARLVWEKQMAVNRTPLTRVADDDSFWVGTPDQIVERMVAYRAIGFDTFISEMAAPYDVETMERLIGEVAPLVVKASPAA
jgi:alkanesulfonate monooxygenase SsuD/methylene tetrahydromethanopterin reductase-like flavin-dependent oxidoreductase (luciferase family)